MMNEVNLRKWHRRMGITLAFFIILQAGTGLLLSLDWVSTPHSHANTQHERIKESGEANETLIDSHEGGPVWHKVLEFIHHGAGSIMNLYRAILGIGIVAMALTGSTIFFVIRARSKKTQI